MARHELIKNYLNHKKEENRQHQIKMEEKKVEEKQTESDVNNILKRTGTKLSWTNGYVYQFDYDGLRYTLCNQTTRTVGEAHIIPETKEDHDFLATDACSAFHMENNTELKNAFKYKTICIDLPITLAIKKLLTKPETK